MVAFVLSLPISLRVHAITLVALVGLFASTTVQVLGHSQRLEADRVELLRGVVEAATSIASRYHAEERAGRLFVMRRGHLATRAESDHSGSYPAAVK
jgi:hypothetical protein